MKKNTSAAITENTEGKSVFYQAGEMIGSIGFHIVDGKDKVIGAIKNKLGKKQPAETKVKKVSKKKISGKAGKKNTGDVKKPAKKINPAKLVKKKTNEIKKPARIAKGKE